MAGTPNFRFHAVTIIGGANCCAAARDLQDVRMLSADAPRLPLAICDQPGTCTCRFQHHNDRRAGPRRITEIRENVRRQFHAHDRRDRRGRRDSDFEEDF